MWLPSPIYERIPQFWFLLGLLFVAAGVYMGFDFAPTMWYLGLGLVCCTYGVWIFFVRLRHRRVPQVTEQTIRPVE